MFRIRFLNSMNLISCGGFAKQIAKTLSVEKYSTTIFPFTVLYLMK